MGRHSKHLKRLNSKSARRRRQNLILGTLEEIKSSSFGVVAQEGTFTIPGRALKGALPGDTVHIEALQAHTARVVHVTARHCTGFVAIYDKTGPLGVARPLEFGYPRDFFVAPQDPSVKKHQVTSGDVVRVTIVEYPSSNSAGVVSIAQKLADGSSADLGFERLMARFKLPRSFSAPVLDEAQAVAAAAHQDMASYDTPLTCREDLTNLCTFTVDPLTARDFDDAVSCTKRADGGYELGVHIADVSTFVAAKTALDREARERSTSVYLADRVIPMLPEELSNDVCSLVPHEERFTLSALIELDAAGQIESYRFTPARIVSRARLTYEQVDAYLKAPGNPTDAPINPAIGAALQALAELSLKRQRLRAQAGSLEFDTVETKMVLDDQSHPQGVFIRRKTAATSLIEDAMLCANICAAQLMDKQGLPGIFRVHEEPLAQKLHDALEPLREMEAIERQDEPGLLGGNPFVLQRILHRANQGAHKQAVTSLLLLCQARARYAPYDLSHYALAEEHYCHFTSPIRRYADLVVHRVIHAYVQEQAAHTSKHAAHTKASRAPQGLDQLCVHISERERAADQAARVSQAIKMAEYYEQRIGHVEAGHIARVESYGIFVVLSETFAQVFVPLAKLSTEALLYDERRLCLRATHTQLTYRLGQALSVKIESCDTQRGYINAALPPHLR